MSGRERPADSRQRGFIMSSTPVLTAHARDRCAEMGIPTKAVKYLVRECAVSYPVGGGRTMVSGPDFSAVVSFNQTPPCVVTVVYRQPFTR